MLTLIARRYHPEFSDGAPTSPRRMGELGHPHTKLTPISPGMPAGQSMISNLILYPRGRK
jgi:hypothetical protein